KTPLLPVNFSWNCELDFRASDTVTVSERPPNCISKYETILKFESLSRTKMELFFAVFNANRGEPIRSRRIISRLQTSYSSTQTSSRRKACSTRADRLRCSYRELSTLKRAASSLPRSLSRTCGGDHESASAV